MPVWFTVILVRYGKGFRFLSGDKFVSPAFNDRIQAREWLNKNKSRYVLDRSNVIPL